MNALRLLIAAGLIGNLRAPSNTTVPRWEPIQPSVREAIVRALGFDPGFDEQMDYDWRGRPALYVAQRGSSSIAVIDSATGLMCRLLHFSNELPHLDAGTALPRREAQDRAMTFLEMAGWRLGPEWRLVECDLVNHGVTGFSWHLVYHKWHRGVRLSANLRLVMHAGSGMIRSFRLDDDAIQSGLELRLKPDEAVAAVAARAGFRRHSIHTLELAIGYETPEREGRQDLFWEMRQMNLDAQGLRDSEVMWARVNARTGRIVDFGMPSAGFSGSNPALPRVEPAPGSIRRVPASLRGWDTASLRKVRWPRTVFERAGRLRPSVDLRSGGKR